MTTITVPEKFLASLNGSDGGGSTGDGSPRDPFDLGQQNIADDAFYDFWFFRRFFREPDVVIEEAGGVFEPESTPADETEESELKILGVTGAEALLLQLDLEPDELARLDAIYILFADIAMLEFQKAGGFAFHGVTEEDFRDLMINDFVFRGGVEYVLKHLFRFASNEGALLFFAWIFSEIAKKQHYASWHNLSPSVSLPPGYDLFVERKWVFVDEDDQDKRLVVLPRWSTNIGPNNNQVNYKPPISGAPDPSPEPVQAEAEIPTELRLLNARTENFGFRLTYRQQWKHVGNQFGPPLRTIPLGPGQKETISIKITRREKFSQSTETAQSSETTRESTSALKDSSEIVEEASKMFKWKIDQNMKGGFDCGLWNLGGTTQIAMDEESRNSSRQAKSTVSESMEKSTSKIRSETKVVVTSESETTFESTATSEIRNANDEIAVTYIYQVLQRQYALNTYLAEVTPVILVPEKVPDGIDVEWLTRNASVIERNLLDETYRDFIRALRSSTAGTDASATRDAYAKLGGAVEDARKAIGLLHTSQGSFESVFDAAFAEFSKLSEARAREQDARARFESMLATLSRHVMDNLLHYLQAIWAAESPEMRAVRYARRLVATSYRYVVGTELVPLGPGVSLLEGSWEVDGDPMLRPLSDLIDPSGPISFHENYAVYALRSTEETRALSELFAYHRLFYTTPVRFIKHPGASTLSLGISTHLPHKLKAGSYTMTFRRTKANMRIIVVRHLSPSATEEVANVLFAGSGRISATSDGSLRIAVNGVPADGETYGFQILPPELEDPEIREIKLEMPLPPPESAAEAVVFDTELIEDMITILPGLMALVTDNGRNPIDPAQGWGAIPSAAKEYFRRYYHEYLVRRRHLRFVVVDTGNVVVNLFTGADSALEPFKRAHRYLDVLKAEQEVERRRLLLATGNFSDPEIERVVRVNTDSD